MPNLSHQVIIPDVVEKFLLLKDISNDYTIPYSLELAIEDLDKAMRQFGVYDGIKEQLIDEGDII